MTSEEEINFKKEKDTALEDLLHIKADAEQLIKNVNKGISMIDNIHNLKDIDEFIAEYDLEEDIKYIEIIIK